MKNRIHMLSLEYPPFEWGGLFTVVEMLKDAFINAGLIVGVGTIGTKEEINFDKKYNYTIKVCINSKGLTRHPIYYSEDKDLLIKNINRRLFSLMQKIVNNGDIIIYHNLDFLEFCKLIKIKRDVKIIYLCHSLEKNEMKKTKLYYTRKELFNYTDLNLVLSDHMADKLNGLYKIKNIKKIIMPLFDFIPNMSLNGKDVQKIDNSLLIVSAGRAVSQKGLDILIKALFLNDGEMPNYRLNVYLGHGDLHYEKYCRSLVSQNGRNNITIKPWKDRHELLKIFANANMVVVPSRFEPFGLVAAEAMTQKTPVIASSVGGLNELLYYGRCGYLIDANDGEGPDPMKLGNSIVELSHNESLRTKISDTAYYRIKEHYNFTNFIKSTNCIFN
jgi:1,4-alpha-glucan branching enzyme